MADVRISQLTTLTTVAVGDFYAVVDVSDTTDSPEGTTKKIRSDKAISTVDGTLTVTGTTDQIVTFTSTASNRVAVDGTSPGFTFLVSGVGQWTWAVDPSAGVSQRGLVYYNDQIAAYAMVIWGDNNWVTVGGFQPVARFHVQHNTLGEAVLFLATDATNDDPNFIVGQGRVATTDATVTTLATLAITASNTYLLEGRVLARRTGGAAGTADDGAVYIRRAMVTTKSGTVTINAVQDGLTQEDQAGWDCTFTVSGSNVLIRVTGAANNNITWHGTFFLQQVGT